MKVIICGGRDYNDYKTVKMILDLFDITQIIHGGASGADSCAARYARHSHIRTRVYPAEWEVDGPSAGPRRNLKMAQQGADLCIAFPGGRGTQNMIQTARKHGIPVLCVQP